MKMVPARPGEGTDEEVGRSAPGPSLQIQPISQRAVNDGFGKAL